MLMSCGKRLLSFQPSSVLWCSHVSNVELEPITQTVHLDCGGSSVQQPAIVGVHGGNVLLAAFTVSWLSSASESSVLETASNVHSRATAIASPAATNGCAVQPGIISNLVASSCFFCFFWEKNDGSYLIMVLSFYSFPACAETLSRTTNQIAACTILITSTCTHCTNTCI